MKFTLPKWYDLHVHFRQGDVIKDYIQAHLDMGCCGALAMPNTKPPIAAVMGENSDTSWTIESYLKMLKSNGGNNFDDIIVPLYLTNDTTPDTIKEGADSGFLRSCKYYPPHGTTNADFGAAISTYMNNGVFNAMEAYNIILNIHGEEHGLNSQDYFDKDSNAEDIFYKKYMPQIIEKFPNLKIVCEHITTKTAVEFVQSAGNNIAATITPQHLMFTVGDLLKGFNYQLYCLPLVKFEEDRLSLLAAATNVKNTKFFAGTDSAPHSTKLTECGCAAGCFTGLVAPQLYAQAFDLNENNFEAFKQFLCINGPQFYGLQISSKTFVLEKKSSTPVNLKTDLYDVVSLPNGMGIKTLDWTLHSS